MILETAVPSAGSESEVDEVPEEHQRAQSRNIERRDEGTGKIVDMLDGMHRHACCRSIFFCEFEDFTVPGY